MRRLCLILWELPLHVQVGLAVAMAERHLPAFERRHPDQPQLREFLVRCLAPDPPTESEVDDWISTLSWEQRGELADHALHAAAYFAALATRQTGDPTAATSACVVSVVHAIGAGEDEVWTELDPEAAAAELEAMRRSEFDLTPIPLNPKTYRSPWRHVQVRNAAYSGWYAVIWWLKVTKRELGQYPDYVDRKTLAFLLREMKKDPRVVYLPHPEMVDAPPPSEPEEVSSAAGGAIEEG